MKSALEYAIAGLVFVATAVVPGVVQAPADPAMGWILDRLGEAGPLAAVVALLWWKVDGRMVQLRKAHDRVSIATRWQTATLILFMSGEATGRSPEEIVRMIEERTRMDVSP